MGPIAPIIAISIFVEGVFTWAFPLVITLVLMTWYFVLIRRRHPE